MIAGRGSAARLLRLTRSAVLLATALVGVPVTAAAQRGTRLGAKAFAIEATGAAAGSLVAALGAHAVLTAARGACDAEDLACLLRRLGVLGAASAVGAAAGGYLAGRSAHTEPSGWGSVLGAVLGVGAGAAVVKGLDELGVRSRWSAALGYAAVQGLTTAAASRVLAAR